MSATDIRKISVDVDLDLVQEQAASVAEELIAAAKMKEGQILVVGCSSSEIAAHTIGCYSSKEVGEAVFNALYKVTRKHGLYLAAQCCEHLNRALIIEEECAALKYGLEMVNVKPQLKAGGSFSTAAWNGFDSPCAVEYIQAHAGIDIGDTLIGMHLRHVAVPVRTKIQSIGSAHVVCARTRLKYIGGERAAYQK
ncbi:MAG: TIGR01440 family protein [Lachnospiraceae bacterium]